MNSTQKLLRILDRAGTQPPQPGDELPEGYPTAFDNDIDQLLRKAITEKHLLRFMYKNQERIVEPHDYGIKNGVVRLFCFQVGGQSNSRLPGWRLVDVFEIHDCEILNRRFAGNRESPSGKHHQWDEVFIRVAPPEKS